MRKKLDTRLYRGKGFVDVFVGDFMSYTKSKTSYRRIIEKIYIL